MCWGGGGGGGGSDLIVPQLTLPGRSGDDVMLFVRHHQMRFERGGVGERAVAREQPAR